jgi:hypothetical protein
MAHVVPEDSEMAHVVPEDSEMAHVAPEEWSGWGQRCRSQRQKNKMLLKVGSIRFLRGARAESGLVYSARRDGVLQSTGRVRGGGCHAFRN